MAIMDRDTAEHFYTWLESHVADDEQHTVEEAIFALLADYPEMTDENRTWSEIRTLAERNAKVPA